MTNNLEIKENMYLFNEDVFVLVLRHYEDTVVYYKKEKSNEGIIGAISEFRFTEMAKGKSGDPGKRGRKFIPKMEPPISIWYRDELLNPARCEECGKMASIHEWQKGGLSHYVCDNCAQPDFAAKLRYLTCDIEDHFFSKQFDDKSADLEAIEKYINGDN